MIDITNNFKGGNKRSVTDYGMSERNHAGQLRGEAPMVVAGSPDHVKVAVQTLTSKKHCASGCLSFGESRLRLSVFQAAVQEHRQIVGLGFAPERMAAAYILHRDTAHPHIHYWHAEVDLYSGLRWSPYVHHVHRMLRRLWVTSFNARFGLTNPGDPARNRLVQTARSYAHLGEMTPEKEALGVWERARKEICQELWHLAHHGVLSNREQTIRYLVMAGWEIVGAARSSLLIARANLRRPVTLRGLMFKEDWSGVIPSEEVERESFAFECRRVERAKEALAELEPRLRHLAEKRWATYGGQVNIEPFIEQLYESTNRFESTDLGELPHFCSLEPEPEPVWHHAGPALSRPEVLTGSPAETVNHGNSIEVSPEDSYEYFSGP